MEADPMREKTKAKLPLLGKAPLLTQDESGAMMK
jgi:hypothetical protein